MPPRSSARSRPASRRARPRTSQRPTASETRWPTRESSSKTARKAPAGSVRSGGPAEALGNGLDQARDARRAHDVLPHLAPLLFGFLEGVDVPAQPGELVGAQAHCFGCARRTLRSVV